MKKLIFILVVFVIVSCKDEKQDTTTTAENTETELTEMEKNLNKYTSFTLTADVNKLTDNERQMIPILIDASKIMNSLFWYEAYGNKDDLLASISDENTKRFVEINYGPWDRLNGNAPFVEGVEAKPAGANFYPKDMTKEEFEAATFEDKNSIYNFVRRNDDGDLYSIPYHEQFKEEVTKASELLLQAAELAEDEGLKTYLNLRAQALLDDNYQPSDLAWMDMKTNTLDVVIGPIETYEDQLFGNKAAHEAYVLIKDQEWSERLAKFSAYLPELQEGLPVDAAYKTETPGTDSDLNAYDVVYYAGDCNSGSKTIAINLPNDEEVQLQKGTRRLQLKNAMRAKFDKILLPISEVLIDESQRQHITFDAFFSNTMFHEVAHGLGIKNTINDKGTVRTALKEHASALEEGKADILGLYMIQQLHAKGELTNDLKDNMVTFMAGIFRSVRFGASSAHGKANMIRFNFFKEKGAFSRNEDGTYMVNFDKMESAMKDLSQLILTLQGNGDYDGVAQLVAEKGLISDELQADLDRLSAANIPVDVVFEQGTEVLGL
ncbi:dipeptidyl-peptidase 3 family protein [Psychroserpens sp.]|uniref:dipeptidyl-peptidase 3 family protein n=1 Tax=Psychroserpens sp. TaxID=2020870 RepID=UPI001B07C9A3|nr:Zn-dependent hydrolase [Psychroserpens sp.]MBO6608002.1 Zn-dependent hydrolase [Psychroserpens sp.]MBO6654871.1 Zn-dependent hydrolase [Psychroserpens sp.]MBO6683055.1 Zn-dependent hydrolase [Psychroserpens sp.]MBO6751360.1 Zn-dependent hydrolase [Psychroserpens sp.]MBO6916543.1 Zn-dependent hydrolase [Psychroserpens sp.]